MRIGKYIVGLISGLTFGMLFAPKKGEKLREDLKKKSVTSGHDALNVLVEAFKEAGMEAMQEAKKLSEGKEMGHMIDASKDKMKEYLTKLETTGYDIASKAQEKLDEIYDMTSDTASGFKKKALNKKKSIQKTVDQALKKVTPQAKVKTPKKTIAAKPKSKPVAKKATTKKKATPKKK